MSEPGTSRRMLCLIGVHIFLAAAPVLQSLFWNDRLLVLSWVCLTLPIGSAMTLSVWLGLGRAHIVWRLLTSLVAVAYLALWLAVGNSQTYLESLIPFGTLSILFGGMFMLLGRFFKLSRDEAMLAMRQSEQFRFSVLHLLLLMSLVAVIFTLLHTVRESSPENASSVLGWRADDSLAVIVFFLNTVCAAYAALWPGNVKRNIGLVLLVSMLLGVVIAFATRNEQSEWQLFIGSMLIGIIPAVLEVVSLLVVRSCGYRLVPKTIPNAVTA